MKRIIYIGWLALIFMGCSDNESEYSLYRYYNDSSVVANNHPDFFVANIEEGEKRVFEFIYVIEADPDIADSGFSETLIFEVDPLLDEFIFTDNELSSINTYYRQICFCALTESVLIDSGTISGKRLNSTQWNISINIQISPDNNSIQTPIEKEISGVFVLNNS